MVTNEIGELGGVRVRGRNMRYAGGTFLIARCMRRGLRTIFAKTVVMGFIKRREGVNVQFDLHPGRVMQVDKFTGSRVRFRTI